MEAENNNTQAGFIFINQFWFIFIFLILHTYMYLTYHTLTSPGVGGAADASSGSARGTSEATTTRAARPE